MVSAYISRTWHIGAPISPDGRAEISLQWGTRLGGTRWAGAGSAVKTRLAEHCAPPNTGRLSRAQFFFCHGAIQYPERAHRWLRRVLQGYQDVVRLRPERQPHVRGRWGRLARRMRVIDGEEVPVVFLALAVDAEQVLRVDAVPIWAGLRVPRPEQPRRPPVDARDDPATLVRRLLLSFG